jgi:hypothetical protein
MPAISTELKADWAIALTGGGGIVLITHAFADLSRILLIVGLLFQIGGFYCLKSVVDPALNRWIQQGNQTRRRLAINSGKVAYCLMSMGGWFGLTLFMLQSSRRTSSILPHNVWGFGFILLLIFSHALFVRRMTAWTKRFIDQE